MGGGGGGGGNNTVSQPNLNNLPKWCMWGGTALSASQPSFFPGICKGLGVRLGQRYIIRVGAVGLDIKARLCMYVCVYVVGGGQHCSHPYL